MRLFAGDRELNFVPVQLMFGKTSLVDLFAAKNNKTLDETLASKKYANLSGEVYRRYPPEALNEKLGSFLYGLKLRQDGFYRCFLHEHGDKIFCEFSISDLIYIQSREGFTVLSEQMKFSILGETTIHLENGLIMATVIFQKKLLPRWAVNELSSQFADCRESKRDCLLCFATK